MHCHHMLERGLSLGMEATDLWFDPLFLVVKGMQDKQMDVLNAIKLFADEGLKSTGGLSNNSNGAPKNVRPIMDSALVAMAMMQGLTSAIVNPNDLRLMETIKSCDIFKNNELYSDSYLDVVQFRSFHTAVPCQRNGRELTSIDLPERAASMSHGDVPCNRRNSIRSLAGGYL